MVVRTSKSRVSPFARIPGARPAGLPSFIEPSHSTQRDKSPTGDQWVHEVQVDDYRAQLHVRDGKVRVYSRRGNDWTGEFQSIADAAKQLPVARAVIDGEVIVATPDGLADIHVHDGNDRQLAERHSNRARSADWISPHSQRKGGSMTIHVTASLGL